MESNRSTGAHRLPIVVFVVCLALYLAVFLLLPAGKGMQTRTTGDETHYLVMTQGLLRNWNLDLSAEYERKDYQKSGYYVGSLGPHLVKGARGRMVPFHQPLTSVLAIPGFWAAGWRGAEATDCLFMALAAMLSFLVLRKFAPGRKAAAVTLFFFLTYPLLAYSHMVYPEVPVLLLLILGTWASLNVKEGGSLWYMLVAGLCAAAMPNLQSKFLILSAGLALLAILCVWRRVKTGRGGSRDFAWLALFFLPLAASLVFLVAWTRYLYGPDIIHGLTISGGRTAFNAMSGWGVFGVFLDRSWGLIPFAPLYLAVFAGAPLPRRRDEWPRWWIFIVATALAYLVVIGSFREWFGGTAPVPRYLIPLMPLLVVLAGLAIARTRKLWVKVVLALLALAQLALTVFARVYPSATLGMDFRRNELYHKFLGGLAAFLDRLFPLLHPVSANSFAVLGAWVVLIAIIVLTRRYYLEGAPADLLRDRVSTLR